MGKISEVSIDEPWNYDYLYDILKDAFRVLYISYNKLYKERIKDPYKRPLNVKKWHIEDVITDDLIKNEETLPKRCEYRLVNQQKDAVKKTRIDIAVQWSLTYGAGDDIKIECKVLNDKNLDYIIDGGINKFKNNSYSEKLPIAGMLFYNTLGSLSQNIERLNIKIEKKISAEEILKQIIIIDNYQNTYLSNHKRYGNSSIKLYTAALEFNNIVSLKS